MFPKLPELQNEMRAQLLGERTGVQEHIRQDSITAAERLDVYQNNVIASLTDSLGDTFPAVKSVVGEAFFNELAKTYIQTHPPREAPLMRYGATLHGFIETYAPASGLPYLPDLARFEWAWNEAYFAPDDHAIAARELESFATRDPAATGMRFRAQVFLLEARFPVDRIFEYSLSEGDRNTRAELNITSDRDIRVILWRPDSAVRCARLSPAEYEACDALMRGLSLNAAFARAESEESAAALIAKLLQWKTVAAFPPVSA